MLVMFIIKCLIKDSLLSTYAKFIEELTFLAPPLLIHTSMCAYQEVKSISSHIQHFFLVVLSHLQFKNLRFSFS